MKKRTYRNIITSMSHMIERQKRDIEFYKCRVQELQRIQKEFPDPYRKMICNIIANGKAK